MSIGDRGRVRQACVLIRSFHLHVLHPSSARGIIEKLKEEKRRNDSRDRVIN